MIQKVTFELKSSAKVNLNNMEYHINTDTHSVEDARKQFTFELALIAGKKNTITSEILKYYQDTPCVVDIKLLGQI
jgi:hypothetical protein